MATRHGSMTTLIERVRRAAIRRLSRRGAALGAAAALLAGCAGAGQPYQAATDGPLPAIYGPLTNAFACVGDFAAKTVIAPHWAVTNAHADGMVAADDLVGEATHADLALVRITGAPAEPLPTATVRPGDAVTFYGTGPCGVARIAHGTVIAGDDMQCYGPPEPGQEATSAGRVCQRDYGMGVVPFIAVRGDAGHGFSGGPVIAQGKLVGIMAGLVCSADDPTIDGAMVVYSIAMVVRTFFPDGDVSREPSGILFRPVGGGRPGAGAAPSSGHC